MNGETVELHLSVRNVDKNPVKLVALNGYFSPPQQFDTAIRNVRTQRYLRLLTHAR